MRNPVTNLLSCSKLWYKDLIGRGFVSKQQCQDVLSHYHQTKKAALLIESDLFPPTFKAAASLKSFKEGISVHADVIKLGFESYTSTSNSIISFYIKCGMMESALSFFNGMISKDSVSWNAVIHGLLSRGGYESGLGVFMEARGFNFVPNVSTLVVVLQACWRLEATREGENIHGFIIKSGFSTVVSVHNSLLSLYVKSQDLVSAQRLFDEMCEKDVISWSVLISGYAQYGEALDALRLFRSMYVDGGIDMDGLAMVSVLQACTSVGNVSHGRSIHAHLIKSGFEADLFVGNSLVDLYAKCSDVDSALSAFNQMPQANIVSWNSILPGLVNNERCLEALVLFDSMRSSGIECDEVTMVTLLQACKKLGLVMWCKCIHSAVVRRRYESNDFVMNSLLDAYTKCHLMELAVKLFDVMERKDVIAWSTMIAGFAHCGKPGEAVAFYRNMQLANETPNSVTMLSLLDACAVSAELKLSKCAHDLAIRNYMADDLAVGTALVDMYAKCGDLNSSRKVFVRMPEKNILSWNTMIGALGMNGRAKEALEVLDDMELENVKPNGVTMLSVLSACSHGGLVREGISCFQRMLKDPRLQPSSEHYSCMVDLLGRAGNLEGALEVIATMPEGLEAGPAAWGALLSACRSYGNAELGRGAAARVLELEPMNSAGYLLCSSMSAKGGGSADNAARMRWLMRERSVRVVAGYSLVHVEQRVHKFVAWDGSHPQSEEIYSVVGHLHGCMKWEERHVFPF